MALRVVNGTQPQTTAGNGRLVIRESESGQRARRDFLAADSPSPSQQTHNEIVANVFKACALVDQERQQAN